VPAVPARPRRVTSQRGIRYSATVAGRDPELGVMGAAQRGDAGPPAGGRLGRLSGPVGHEGAGRSERRALPAAAQELHPEQALELANTLAGGPLADPVLARRGAQAARAGDREEQIQRGQIRGAGRERHLTSVNASSQGPLVTGQDVPVRRSDVSRTSKRDMMVTAHGHERRGSRRGHG
jgi:hypothetical protein